VRQQKPQATFDCIACGSAFPSNAQLQKHCVESGHQQIVMCERCLQAFPSDSDLDQHYKKTGHHLEQKDKNMPPLKAQPQVQAQPQPQQQKQN
jgi:predicted RNA-binding Zn-ribbon protein involved in translation (DUF1610 family)